jgi:tRNA(fMet)-specific endonuclease VapC
MYLIDTDTIIFALKGVPAVVAGFERHRTAPMAISVVTYGELLYGAMKSARRHENLARVRRVAEIYPVIDVSRGVMDTFGALKADLEKKGKRIDDFDLVIASTALMLGYGVVTNNERHFRVIPGLRTENWSRAPATS